MPAAKAPTAIAPTAGRNRLAHADAASCRFGAAQRQRERYGRSTHPRRAGPSQSSGLGNPAQNVAATAQLTFDPASVAVKGGAVIQWKNTGSVPHNVTFDDQPALTSLMLAQGDTWEVQIDHPGTDKYHCTFHPGMDGQVTVGGLTEQ